MTNVTRSPGTTVWMWSFFFMIIGAMILSIGAISYETAYTVENTASGVVHEDNNYSVQEGIDDLFWAPTRLTAPGAFAYIPSESLQYPTCRLVEGMEFESNSETALVDYTFLATVIYQAPETLQDPVDSWFGPGVGTIETDLVAEFRLNVSGGLAAVNYNVITMADNSQVVIVRGSTRAWEWLTNAQIWASVAMVEVFQFFLPAGEVFNPIWHGLLRSMAWIESEKLTDVSLYSQTTRLVEDLRNRPEFTGTLRITGQSLGGEISLITGAQQNIPAVAISGPDNKFTRDSLLPALDLEIINTMLFDVIPERDMVPLVRGRMVCLLGAALCPFHLLIGVSFPF